MSMPQSTTIGSSCDLRVGISCTAFPHAHLASRVEQSANLAHAFIMQPFQVSSVPLLHTENASSKRRGGSESNKDYELLQFAET